VSGQIALLDAALQPGAIALVAEARDAGLSPVVTSTRRTYAEQKRLYEKFLAGQSQYPASPPGVGSHEFGWAFDMVVSPMDYLDDLGDLWESWGGTWGGNWRNPDRIHFELKGASQEALRLGGAGVSPPGIGSRTVHSLVTGAIDVILGLNPAIGLLELAAWLVSLGYPKSEIAKALSAPVSYLFP
jgi:hypothetical protein